MENSKKLAIIYASSILLALPALSMAYTLCSLINAVVTFLEVIFVAAGTIYFLVYGIMFLTARGEADKVAEARQGVLWGVVGIVVGALALGIVTAVTNFFGLGVAGC